MAMRAWRPSDAGGGVTVREFDPSIAANIDVSGGLVTALRSSDGSLSAQPTTSAESPAYIASGINGGPTIRFYNNGVANRLKTAAFTQGPNWAVFAVVKQNENTGTQSIIDADNFNTGSGNRIAQYLRWDGTNIQTIAFTPTVSTASAATAQGTNLVTKILAASLPSRTVQVSVDGGTLATATLNADPISAPGLLTLGSWTANNQNLRGDVAIWYHVQGVLSQDDYDRFVGYLAWRYALQGNLPAAHPYKNAAPTIDDGTSSSTTASLATTEGQDTATASGSTVTAGALSASEGQDTASAAGGSQITGTLSGAEALDTVSISGTTGSGAYLTAAEGADSAAASGASTITGTLSATEARDTAVLTSQGGASNLSATEQADSASAVGSQRTQADAAALEAPDTATGSASSGSSVALSTVETADALAGAAGSRASADLSSSEAPDSAALAGTTGGRVNAALGTTEGKDTAAIRGEVFTRPTVILVAQRGDRIVLPARRNAPLIIKAHRAAS